MACKYLVMTIRKDKFGVIYSYSCRMGVMSSFVPSHCKDCTLRVDA